MKRHHLFEIEDQPWCPRIVRNGVTDYLQYGLVTMKPYAAIAPLLAKALQSTRAIRVVDLCSGGSGPWLWLQGELAKLNVDVTVLLTDAYPNLEAFKWTRLTSAERIQFSETPVDATKVPENLKGFRTLFTSFHHFRPQHAEAILRDAVCQRQGIAIFELTQRSARCMVMTLAAPLMSLVVTPFIRPFRWSRLLWTYVVPAIPLVTLIDGLISCLRSYTVPELKQMTVKLRQAGYQWDLGMVRARGPVFVTYLIGTPGDQSRGVGFSKAGKFEKH